jgi:hypothetical protein
MWSCCDASTRGDPLLGHHPLGCSLLDWLQAGVTVERAHRVVDGEIVSSAGVASGIDMAFSVVETLVVRCGRCAAVGADSS